MHGFLLFSPIVLMSELAPHCFPVQKNEDDEDEFSILWVAVAQSPTLEVGEG